MDEVLDCTPVPDHDRLDRIDRSPTGPGQPVDGGMEGLIELRPFREPTGGQFEHGLDQAEEIGARPGYLVLGQLPTDLAQRQFGDIAGDHVGPTTQQLRGHRSHVRSLQRDDTGVLTERAEKLAMTDIDGVDTRCAVIEEGPGETTGAGAQIQGHCSVEGNIEVLEGGCELSHPLQCCGRLDHDPGGWEHLGRRVGHDGTVDQHPLLGQRRSRILDRWIVLGEPAQQRYSASHPSTLVGVGVERPCLAAAGDHLTDEPRAAEVRKETWELRLSHHVDLIRHRIGDEAYAAACRAKLDATGALVLAAFFTSEAINRAIAESAAREEEAFYTSSAHNVYLTPNDPAYGLGHTANRRVVSSKGLIANDQIPVDSPLRQVYEDATFRAFLCGVLGVDEVFPYADELSSINVHFAPDGKELGWHFDNSSFAVTMLLQGPEAGGVFEYVADVRRNADDPAFEQVSRVLDGVEPAETLRFEPGDLVLFRGHNSMHRVTPTRGSVTRMLVVFAFNDRPGVELSESALMTFYGRTS